MNRPLGAEEVDAGFSNVVGDSHGETVACTVEELAFRVDVNQSGPRVSEAPIKHVQARSTRRSFDFLHP